MSCNLRSLRRRIGPVRKTDLSWKWIHTPSCPEIEEYGGCNNLRKYCINCLREVLFISSTDWRNYSFAKNVIKFNEKNVRSLQHQCVKKIIDENIPYTQLPNTIQKQIQDLKSN